VKAFVGKYWNLMQAFFWASTVNRPSVRLAADDCPGEPFEAKYWNMTQGLIWVSTGNRTFVRLAADDFLSHGSYDAIELIGKAVERGLCCPFEKFEDAQNDIINRLSNGDLHAWGRRNGEGAHEEIPDKEWRGLQFYPAGMAETRLWPERSSPHAGRPDGVTRVRGADEGAAPPFWTDVIFERAAVLENWSDPLQELLNNKHPKAPLSEAGLERWYLARMKACDDAGRRYYSRDEDEKAAREEFGQRVTTQRIRKMRNRLLPSEVRRGGAPRKDKLRPLEQE
jgi:hypothetical protein